MTLEPDEIARRLRAARELRDVDQRDPGFSDALAENRLGWTTVQRIERGKREARPMELRAIAEALDVPYRWFTDPDPFAGNGDAASAELLAEISSKLDRLLRLAGRVDDALLDGHVVGQRDGDAEVLPFTAATGPDAGDALVREVEAHRDAQDRARRPASGGGEVSSGD